MEKNAMTHIAPTTSKVTYLIRDTASIDDYFSDSLWIWQRDAEERTVFDLWLHVVDHCSRLVEAVRKERPKEVIDDLANTFMWFLSFIAQTHQSKNELDKHFRLNTMPSDIIWNKYPARCPACFDFSISQMIGAETSEDAERLISEKHASIRQEVIDLAAKSEIESPVVCKCLSRIGFAEERHNTYKKINKQFDEFRLIYANETNKQGKKVTGIQALEDMFEKVFGNAYEVFNIQNIAFHLLEEVGEVTQSIKDLYTYDYKREPFTPELQAYRTKKFEEELADVFSWIFALMLKIRRVYYRDAQAYFETLIPKNLPITVNFNFLEKIHLADIIWSKYGSDKDGNALPTLYCTGCFDAPCSCERDLRIEWAKVQNVTKE
jgi:NTP pyrophosphatase (non-canonical NTP hydrolase)